MTEATFVPRPGRRILALTGQGTADDGGTLRPRILPEYARAAVAGLVLAEPAWISPQGAGGLRAPGIARESHITAWSAVADAVHGAGGRVALPLWHAGRLSHPRVQPHGGWPVAPSALAAPGEIVTPEGARPYPTPRALDATELPALVAAYAAAAVVARRAGFDAVEVHAADGGLIEQFLDAATNLRDDAHGGGPDGRARLLIEIVDAVADAIGAARTGVRISDDAVLAGRLAGRGVGWLHLVGAVAPHRRVFDRAVILGHPIEAEAAARAIAMGAADALVETRVIGAATPAHGAFHPPRTNEAPNLVSLPS